MDFSDILDFFFPNSCFGCGKEQNRGRVLCRRCEPRLPINRSLFCSTCFAPHIGTLSENLFDDDRPLDPCHLNAKYILGAAGSYDHPIIQRLVHALKFDGIRQASLPLGRLLVRYLLKIHINLGSVLVLPIPLHKRREQLRGFNQSDILGRIVSDYFGYEFSDRTLSRVHATLPQSTLAYDEREENVQGCFAVINVERVMNRTILLIDDVTTSGSTFEEATKALLGSGARSVIALAVAKA